MTAQATTLLASLSDELANAVAAAARSAVTVNGRRRMPATGIVWNPDGLIVTASHVVERDEDITVDLPDGRTVPATLVGRDTGTDLALLSTGLTDLTPATRSTQEPRVGHLALAIGRPGPSGPMASFGAISTVGGAWRTPRGATVDGYIRADVAMLPGFSGGPLVDGAGAVIGLNSSTLGRGGGLTIPGKAIDEIVAALQSYGRVRRGYIGIGTQQVCLSDAQLEMLGRDDCHALLIVQIEDGSPADRDGILLGDILLGVAGAPTPNVEALQDQLPGDRAGQPLDLQVLRGGHPVTVTTTPADR
ncbi:MAG: S1C family serine protease [Thermomicrobiales bacterium]